MNSDNTARSNTAPWHAISADEIQQKLNVDPAQGLTIADAAQRLATHGPNRLPQSRKTAPLLRFLAQVNNILIYVLLAAGFIKLMLGLWLDASIIFAVVILNSLLGFFQEGQAEKALDSIRNMLSADARVLRSGSVRFIPAENLVPGDIVLLESGDKVPADLRLIDARNLRTEEAALTGESLPAEKNSAPVPANATVGDRENMAFSGTLVLSGRATGIGVATGSQTELGRINQMLAEVKGGGVMETPLLRQIKKFGYVITAIILILSALLFSWGHWLGHMTFVQLFQAVVGIAVSVIPEGLPALITITLAIGVQRMARRNAIIRRLPAVETLGAVSRICSDKTGTLTLMEMMVTSAVTADATYQITGNGYSPEGKITLLSEPRPSGSDPPQSQSFPHGRGSDRHVPDTLTLMARVSLLCNDAELLKEEGDGEKWKVEGDPTEGALYPFAAKLGMERSAEALAAPRIDAIPFESEHKFMATLNRSAAGGGDMLLVKGAPEVILANCDRQQTSNGPAPLDHDHFAKEGDRLAAQGERVLGLAWLPNPETKTDKNRQNGLKPDDLPKNLIFLGLIGLMDPPRKEAIDAVRDCHAGGIRVTMITGDHKITAAAIAKMLNIGDGKTAVAGSEIESMNDDDLQECVQNVDVFARASPEHKLRLVKAIQANRQIVAMTGDGVNDAPALRKADIGIAMGIKGTEVTKEAAEMILADDNFASISAAVKEGRTVFNNIEKALLFMLPTNVAQGAVIAGAILFAFTLPITAPQVLWVNMVTSVALGMAISFEPHEADVMRRRPRAINRPLVTAFGLWRICFVGGMLLLLTLAIFFRMKSQGVSDQLARTAAVNAITLGQVFYLLNSRYLLDSSLSLRAHMGNAYLWYGIVGVIALQLLFTYAPPFQAIFNTESLPLFAWFWLITGAFIFFLLVEAEKLIMRRYACFSAR
ncbi:MAG: HAD-IC family P-type ATPase [Phycisphaerales bacterium]|nr:HAD-IC family P-type ATPase [Phycisphaerales bacterium]